MSVVKTETISFLQSTHVKAASSKREYKHEPKNLHIIYIKIARKKQNHKKDKID